MRLPLHLKLLAMVALPVIATSALWLTSLLARRQTNTRYENALRWSEHALAAREEALLATEYMSLVRRAVHEGDAASLQESRTLAAHLLAASERSTVLAAQFDPAELKEETELREGMVELIDTASRAMALGRRHAIDALRFELQAQASALAAGLTAKLEARVQEEAEGSRGWQASAQEAADFQRRLGELVAFASALILLPTFVFAQRLRRSLQELHQGALRVAQRDFSTAVQVSSAKGELRELVVVFNEMVWSLETHRTTELAAGAALAASNAELKDALATVGALSEAKSRFLSTMSHELRTPLGGVMGTLELLATGALNPEQQEYIALSLRSAKALLSILNDVLDLSKIEAQGVTLETAPFDARQALREVRDLFLAQAERKELELTVVNLTGPLCVKGDALRFKQVLSNLVGNAIKFTQTGGVRMIAEASGGGPEAELRFTVEDTGVGIAVEHQEALFAPFAQGGTSTQRRFGGTGLGLAISRRLARAMGGDLTFDSVEGQGSRFHFTVRLPRAQAELASASGASSLAASERDAVRGLRVLVAEDNPINRLVISRLLQRLECVTSVVDDGAQALASLRTSEFDVVLMDVQMPVLDGLAATRALRAAGERWSNLPVVALTANAFQDDRLACAAAGMTDFLCKPVNEPQLVRALMTATGQSASSRSEARALPLPAIC